MDERYRVVKEKKLCFSWLNGIIQSQITGEESVVLMDVRSSKSVAPRSSQISGNRSQQRRNKYDNHQ